MPVLEQAECRKDPKVAAAFADDAPHHVMAAACAACVERPECLAWALEHEQWGFWGGYSETDRSKLRRTHHIALIPMNAQPYIGAGVSQKEERRGRLTDAA